jgi:hypothetical protein
LIEQLLTDLAALGMMLVSLLAHPLAFLRDLFG